MILLKNMKYDSVKKAVSSGVSGILTCFLRIKNTFFKDLAKFNVVSYIIFNAVTFIVFTFSVIMENNFVLNNVK